MPDIKAAAAIRVSELRLLASCAPAGRRATIQSLSQLPITSCRIASRWS